MPRRLSLFVSALVALSLLLGLGLAQKTLTIARPTDPVSLDPQFETTAPGSWVFSQILEPLITTNQNMEIEGRLATAWEFVDDNRLRFTLREGVTFHDGTPFNADAVKFTWERAFEGDPPGRWKSLAGPVEGIEIVDEYTVDLVAAQPYGPLLLTATMPYTGIVSPTAVEEMGEDFSRAPVGTGPFSFVEWRSNERIVLEAFDDYWRGRPALDQVIFRTIPEEGARMLSLRAGEVDMVLLPTPSDLPGLEADPNFIVEGAPGVGVFYLAFNLDREAVADVRVRQAVAHAVDRQLIVDAILEGGGVLATSVIGEPVFGYKDMRLTERYPYDPERARELLEEAGYTLGDDGLMRDADGETLTLELLPSNGRSLKDREIAEALQEFLRQVGIDVEMDIFEWATTFELMRGAQLDYDLNSFTWFTTTADADYTMYSNYVSDQLPPSSWNRWRYANDDVDEWLKAARASLDPDEREALYGRVQDQLAEDLPALPLYGSYEVAALSADVTGFVAHPIQYILDLFPVDKTE
ncbi:MAG TPA: ABC transporter substrate-binding protein [Longimicrobiales bacterium]|nr:ABC transporter substrate-binding protein [Longimicrobiales bacterium]